MSGQLSGPAMVTFLLMFRIKAYPPDTHASEILIPRYRKQDFTHPPIRILPGIQVNPDRLRTPMWLGVSMTSLDGARSASMELPRV
jgi:hypothetical protein